MIVVLMGVTGAGKTTIGKLLAQRLGCEFLSGGIELIRSRLDERRHRYMPASLLESQFAALEPPAPAIRVDIGRPPERCVEDILAALA